jgi:hypothetical protein
MPHIASLPSYYHGKAYGNGHCVALVCSLTGLPSTSHWRRGASVHSVTLEPGTAVATFDPDGRYGNHTDQSSHAAVLLGQHDDGSITVFDQWVGQSPHQRVIRNRQGAGKWVNDASRYYVIEISG